MALTEVGVKLERNAESDSVYTGSGNDGFTFWKIPDALARSLANSLCGSEKIAEWYLHEHYLGYAARRPPARMKYYYALKRFIPPEVRNALRALTMSRPRVNFPAWPLETRLLDFERGWLRHTLDTAGAGDAWHIAAWPENYRCAIVLTHDVESPAGVERMEAMAELEDRYGFRSSWNVPLGQYPVDWSRFEALRAAGFEIGAHGLSHDGRLFRSRSDFDALRPILEERAREHGLRGFRSPSTLRVAEWIATMDFDYDASYADVDPFEPQPGGSLSFFPFFLGPVVELPYTLPQDHTLLNVLHRDPLPVWESKARWLAAHGGMILVLTHPDYIWTPDYRSSYEELLKRLADIDSAWRALPGEVASWWRTRAALGLDVIDGAPKITGDGAGPASARRLIDDPLFMEETTWPAF
jgi:peptidoglycan/xylan/chitin deacetylase (PgdA/CDA1 family)